MSHILVIDDDPDICLLLKNYLKRHDYDVDTAYTLKKGLSSFKKVRHDVVLCDYRLPDGEGTDMIQRIKALHPSTNIIIMTGYSDVKLAVKCIRQGAMDYVTKPIHPEEILHSIKRAAEKSEASQADAATARRPSISKRRVSSPSDAPGKTYVEGVSPQSQQVKKLINLVAPTDMAVIIQGETGTGKEYAARRIHQASGRSSGPFIAIDCGAISKELAASELFGHKKGAFTGAVADKVGAFEQANGGTLFLDEIANLDYTNQVKLLRVLQERVIKRLGETKERKVDVRLIAATNEDLWDKAQQGGFREDLFHRLNEFSIKLSPLRNRPKEIEQFAEHFIERANDELDKSVEGMQKDALQLLMQHQWHGNLRELRNVIKRAVLLAEGKKLKPIDFPPELTEPSMLASGDDNGMQLTGSFGSLKEAAESAERLLILQTLERTAYNKSRTAELLQVDRKTLYNKIKSYDIDIG